MRRLLQHLWGIFYRGLSFLERSFPRVFPGTPQGKFLPGDEQLRLIKTSIDGELKLVGVQIMPLDDACAVCKSLSHQTYEVESAPPIPVPDCPYGSQCRAIYVPVIDYGLYRVTQILTAQPKLKVQEVRQLLKESDK